MFKSNSSNCIFLCLGQNVSLSPSSISARCDKITHENWNAQKKSAISQRTWNHFTCSDMWKIFALSASLFNRVNISVQKNCRCSFCSASLKNVKVKEKKACLRIDKRHSCPVCRITLTRAIIHKTQLKARTQMTFVLCSFCLRQYFDLKTVQRHIRNSQRGNVSLFAEIFYANITYCILN